METVVTIVALVLAVGLLVLGVWYWVKTLNEINRNEIDPKERRKWWWRVFLLRPIGILWYQGHRRKTAPDREPPAAGS